ncbi:pncA [Symbiodinium microadriaticum]|nr:pncA [Symbiodinium microadriaticum]
MLVSFGLVGKEREIHLQKVDEIFTRYDENQNGELEVKELANFLRDAFPGTQLTDEEVATLTAEFDADQNGTIGLNELRAFLRCYDAEQSAMQRKSALVVIDVQNDFIDGTLANKYEAEKIVPIINQIRDDFDVVVISYDWHPHEHCSFVESANDGKVALQETDQVGKFEPFQTVTLLSDPDRAGHSQMLYPRHAVQDAEGAKCHEDLVLKSSDLSVYKGVKPNIDSYSAFFDNCKANDTGLRLMLEENKVTDVYCCGLVFDICVKSSALHGAELGFRVSVIEDACRPLSESEVGPTKDVLQKAGVNVLSSTAAVEEAKKIRTTVKMEVKEYIKQVKQHKHASSLHRMETLSSHAPQ